MRLIDWIWTVRGSVPLPEGLDATAALARLEPLWQFAGTTRALDGATLTFAKRNPGSQDPMAIYDRGTLGVTSAGLGYCLSSRALAACFCAPAFFLGTSVLIDGAQISGQVFAALFVALYLGGRVLEPWLAARRIARLLGTT